MLTRNLLLLLNTLIESYTYLISFLKSYLSMYNRLWRRRTNGCSNALVNLTPSLSRRAGHSAITTTRVPSIRYMIRLSSVLPQQTLRYLSTTTINYNKTQSISP